MKRICFFILGGLFIFVSFLFAADFWESKDYSSWDEKETLKMLEDSPWAKKVRIREDQSNEGARNGAFGGFGRGGFGGGMGGGMGAPPPGGGSGGSMGAPRGGSASTSTESKTDASDSSSAGDSQASTRDSQADNSSGEENSSSAPTLSGGGGGSMPPGGGGFGGGGMGGGMGGGGFGGGGFGGFGGAGQYKDRLGGLPVVVLRWQSALPVKEAMMRFRYKDEVKTSEEAAQSLNRKENAHILGVIGMPGRLQNYNAEFIKKNSILKFDKRPDIHPAEVVVQQEGTTISLYLFFPKYNEDGTPTITLEDKDFEVNVEAYMFDVKKKFGLKDMVFKGGLDF